MPDLNVISWNSTGETPAAGHALSDVMHVRIPACAPGWIPHVIAIQEAQQLPGGPIHQMLSGAAAVGNHNIVPVQNYLVSHVPEGLGGNRGYIVAVYQNAASPPNFVTVTGALGIESFGGDAGVTNFIHNNIPLNFRLIALQTRDQIRSPAAMGLQFGGRTVILMTWHTSRGPSRVTEGGAVNLPGGVQPDSFLFLQNSNFYANSLNAPGMTGLSVIAADLNLDIAAINQPTGWVTLPRILPAGRVSQTDWTTYWGEELAGCPIT